MAVEISRKNVFFAFGPHLKAIAQIEQDEEVLLQTHDCFEGQIQTTRDLVDALDWGHVNPATGRCTSQVPNRRCLAHRYT